MARCEKTRERALALDLWAAAAERPSEGGGNIYGPPFYSKLINGTRNEQRLGGL